MLISLSKSYLIKNKFSEKLMLNILNITNLAEVLTCKSVF